MVVHLLLSEHLLTPFIWTFQLRSTLLLDMLDVLLLRELVLRTIALLAGAFESDQPHHLLHDPTNGFMPLGIFKSFILAVWTTVISLAPLLATG